MRKRFLTLAGKSDDEKRRLFIEALEKTGKMSEARKASGASYYLVAQWRQSIPDFETAIQSAQETSIEELFDKLDDALTIYPNPQQAKVFSDNLKWKLAKLKPERFGDRLDLRQTLTLDLTERFRNALERLSLRPSRDLALTDDSQVIDITPLSDSEASDMQTETRPQSLENIEREPFLTGKGGGRGAAPKTCGASDALPPLHPYRGEENSKDYAEAEEPR